MKTVQRTDTKAETLWVIVKFAYYFLALPFLIIMAPITLIGTFGHTMSKPDEEFYAFTFGVWAALIIPLSIRHFVKLSRRRRLDKMVALLSRPDRFSPQKQHQVMDVGGGKYFGIDTRHGTLLYIHRVKKDVIDVIGLSMKDWTRRQLEGSALRLYTRMPDMPVLSIHAHPSVARVLFDTLDAMSHNHYDDPFPDAWPEYVKQQSRFIEFEHDVVVPQVA